MLKLFYCNFGQKPVIGSHDKVGSPSSAARYHRFSASSDRPTGSVDDSNIDVSQLGKGRLGQIDFVCTAAWTFIFDRNYDGLAFVNGLYALLAQRVIVGVGRLPQVTRHGGEQLTGGVDLGSASAVSGVVVPTELAVTRVGGAA